MSENVVHRINEHVLVIEQVDDMWGTLGFDVFVDEIYRGSAQYLDEALRLSRRCSGERLAKTNGNQK